MSGSYRGYGRSALGAGSLLLLIAAALGGGSAHAQEPICETGEVAISVDFPAGGRHDCRVVRDGQVVLTVPPENRPINGSPWYAFRVDAKGRERVVVELDYGDDEHRYAPKISHDGVKWRALRPSDIVVSPDESRARLTLNVPDGRTYVAAQPIETPAAMHEWMRVNVMPHGFSAVQYGQSIDGRPLIGYVAGQGDQLIVAITRQHPPETTGAGAFRAFVEELTAEPDFARLLETNRILFAPAPNPDGVMRGYWRHNVGGKDLNRDWGKNTQPEIATLSAWILSEAANRKTIAFYDFHSTGRNVVYSPPLDSASPTIDLLPHTRTHLDQTLKSPPPWSYNHNSNGGTSKGWALETLGAPGITVELDDHASAADINGIGKGVATALKSYLAARAP